MNRIKASIGQSIKKSAGVWATVDICKMVVVVIIVTAYKRGEPLFINMITNDSMFSSATVITETIFRRKSDYTCEHSLLHRYIYYFLAAALVVVLNVITWWNYDTFLYWLVIISTCPPVLNRILSTRQFSHVHVLISRPVRKLIKWIFTSAVAWLINTICDVSLSIRAKISRVEIKYLIADGNINQILVFVKSFLIAAIMNHCDHAGKHYSWMFNTLYQYGFLTRPTEDDPALINIDCDRDKLISIITRRRWSQFYNPRVIKILLRLYSADQSNILARMVDALINSAESSVIKFFAVYTITTLFSSRLLIIPLIWGLYLFDNQRGVIKIIPRVIATFAALYNYGSIILLVAIAEIGEHSYNRATRWFAPKLYNYLAERTWMLYRINDELTELILYPIFVNVIARVCHTEPYAVIIIGAASSELVKSPKLMLIYVTAGIFSGYNIVQLYLISIGYYLYVNAKNIPNSRPRPIKLNIITDYVPAVIPVVEITGKNNNCTIAEIVEIAELDESFHMVD